MKTGWQGKMSFPLITRVPLRRPRNFSRSLGMTPRAKAAWRKAAPRMAKGRGGSSLPPWDRCVPELGGGNLPVCALSTTQRIETKRHRVCLEVPEEVVSKNEEDEAHYGKRPRLNLIPPRAPSQDVRRTKGLTCFRLSCAEVTVSTVLSQKRLPCPLVSQVRPSWSSLPPS